MNSAGAVSPPSLARLLLRRMLLAGLPILVFLVIVFFVKHLLFGNELREGAMLNEATKIARALAKGESPSAWRDYTNYPTAYAFRAIEVTNGVEYVAGAANQGYLPPWTEDDRPSGLGTILVMDGNLSLLICRQIAGEHEYLVTVMMNGDPAWHWRFVVGSEFLEDVAIPGFVVGAGLILAGFIALRHAIRPLSEVAAQARSMNPNGTLVPLSEEGLPREARDVVAALNALLGRLERTIRHQQQFAADAAHELRTPLAVMRLELDRLAPDPALDSVRDELDGLSLLVTQLLRFAQAEDLMGREECQMDLVSAARRACEPLVGEAIARRVSLELDVPSFPVSIVGVPSLLEVAIRNLVDNAVKASSAGGSVAIAVTPHGEIVVEDTGVGLPEGQVTAMFRRYQRGDNSRPGHGIGLALVRRIAELHGGQVVADDRPGGGARFTLSLRASQRIS